MGQATKFAGRSVESMPETMEPFLDPKRAKAWRRASKAIVTVADRVEGVSGVLSVHAQYAEPTAVIVVLVDTEEAKSKVRRLRDETFEEWPDAPLDLRVRRIAPHEVGDEHAALRMAYGLVWSRQ